MACDSLISKGTTLPCNHSTEGSPQELYLGNLSEIDKIATLVTEDIITTLVLASGAKLYQIGANKKTLTSIGTAFKSTDYQDGDGHTITFTLPYISDNERIFLNSLTKATVYAIVKNKAGHYYVYGFDQGLELTERNWNLSENSGVASVTLSTAEQDVESRMKYLLKHSDSTHSTTESFVKANL